jgi:hypothetical protein
MEEEPPRVTLKAVPSNSCSGRHFFGQTVEDEIEIGFSCDGDIEGFDWMAGNLGIHKTSYYFIA